MSGLPDEQPLTRRQARASERSGHPESGQIDVAAAQQAAAQQAAAQQAAAAQFAAQQAAAQQAAAQQAAAQHQLAATQRAEAEARAHAAAEASAWAPRTSEPLTRPESGVDEVEKTLEIVREEDSGVVQGVPERTLTRRELRALLEAQGAGAGAPSDGELDAVDAAILNDTPVAPQAATAAPQQAASPTVGHWSLDIDVEDDADDQGYDQLLSRGVGAGGVPTTTNALILPMIPQQPSTGSIPLTSGEMLVTGSISLPNLGATGAHPNRIDSPDVDRLLEQVDDASPSTSASPIRASRAVSTHTSALETLTPPKQNGLNVPTILAITAAVLALGVIGLVVGGYIFRIF